MQTRTDAKGRGQIFVARSRQSLSNDVGQHQHSLTVLQLDFIANVMVFDVNMLGTSMINRILRHLDARLVVFHDLEIGSSSIYGGI